MRVLKAFVSLRCLSWFRSSFFKEESAFFSGWKEEGIRRKYVYKNGEYKDLYITGVLAEDYYRLIENNRYWE